MAEKSSVYPALEELHSSLSPQQLRILKDQVDSEKPDVSAQTKFNYAWGLIKSDSYKYQQEGIWLLTEVYADDKSLRRECLYYLSLGSYKVGDYTNARRYIDTLLQEEPQNTQARSLKETIDENVTRDGLIGLGIAGGVLAIGIGLMGAFMRKKR
ncbi:uncharacterized protein RJT20DRAFT_129276 [Scheffersomyces xylosifermentans]|uniref:uncharacterized protein n=1 Tax=Scheffersomyces xylosifermentans TaxID=1304137 RepID=UPI00315CDF03